MANIDKFDDDFGFTTVDIGDVQVYNDQQGQIDALKSTLTKTQERLVNMRSAIEALLKNLEKNPSQEIIKWPNRLQKIKEFRAKLDRIQKGEE